VNHYAQFKRTADAGPGDARCSIRGCKRIAYTLGMCNTHYLRVRAHGDPHAVKHPTDYLPRGKDASNYKHGMTGHPLWGTWRGAMSRCYKPCAVGYKDYGGRGIQVHEPWHDAGNFIRDILAEIGERPEGQSLDRKDNDDNYRPGNVQWSTRVEQARTKRTTKLSDADIMEIKRRHTGGEMQKDIAAHFGVSRGHISAILSGLRRAG